MTVSIGPSRMYLIDHHWSSGIIHLAHLRVFNIAISHYWAYKWTQQEKQTHWSLRPHWVPSTSRPCTLCCVPFIITETYIPFSLFIFCSSSLGFQWFSTWIRVIIGWGDSEVYNKTQLRHKKLTCNEQWPLLKWPILFRASAPCMSKPIDTFLLCNGGKQLSIMTFVEFWGN